MSHIGNYALCLRRRTIKEARILQYAQAGNGIETDASVALTFFDDALVAADEGGLGPVWVNCPHLTAAIRQAKIKKPTT